MRSSTVETKLVLVRREDRNGLHGVSDEEVVDDSDVLDWGAAVVYIQKCE